jgi:hypothetical protein
MTRSADRIAAERDRVVRSRGTRKRIARALQMRNKTLENPWRKHIPL